MEEQVAREPEAAGWRPDPTGRHELRYWDGTSWTGHVSTGGRQSVVEPPVVPIPVPPRSGSHVITQRLDPSVTRRVLWNLYAVPLTVLLLLTEAGAIGRLGGSAALDAAISLPMLVAMHLHIWDRRTLSGVIWRTYAFGFVLWQVAYTFVITPSAEGRPVPLAAVAIGLGFQAPMFIALFRYAFRRWETQAVPSERATQCHVCGTTFTGAGACPRCGIQPRPSTRMPSALALSAGAGCIVLLVMYGPVLFGLGQRAAMDVFVPVRIVDAGLKPPVEREKDPQGPGLPVKERARLRGLFEKGDFKALDASLGTIQAAFVRDQTRELQACQAFNLFDRRGDGKRLDAWVAQRTASYAARLARAEYHYESGWRARGTDWAANTSPEQFRGMHEEFAAALEDIDAALAMNPDLVEAYHTRIGIHMAQGEEAEQDAAFEEGIARFPRSYDLYSSMLNAKLPRWGGSYEEMDRLIRRAIAADGGTRMYALYARFYKDQADVLSMQKRYDKAIEVYGKGLAYGEDAEVLWGRAWVYRRIGKSELALKDLDRTLAISPTYVEARVNRAYILVDRGDVDGAIRDIRAAEEVRPDDPAIAEWKTWARKKLGSVKL